MYILITNFLSVFTRVLFQSWHCNLYGVKVLQFTPPHTTLTVLQGTKNQHVKEDASNVISNLSGLPGKNSVWIMEDNIIKC